MESAQQKTETATDSGTNLNQKLYLASFIIGLISAALLSVPHEVPSAIGGFGAALSAGCILAIPYNLLGEIGG